MEEKKYLYNELKDQLEKEGYELSVLMPIEIITIMVEIAQEKYHVNAPGLVPEACYDEYKELCHKECINQIERTILYSIQHYEFILKNSDRFIKAAKRMFNHKRMRSIKDATNKALEKE